MGEPVSKRSAAWRILLTVAVAGLFALGKLYGPELLSLLPTRVHSVQIASETASDESDEFRYSMRLPVFKASDPDVQQVLNALAGKIGGDARADVDTMRERAEKDAAWAKEAGYALPRYEYGMDFEVTHNRDNLLSVNTTRYFYYGGAHGEPLLLSYNVDLRNRRVLTIDDLFDDARTAKDTLTLGVHERIKADPAKYFPDAVDKADVPNDQQFYLEGGQIILHYGIYELAPYAAGLPEFAFGVDELGKVLKPGIRRSLERVSRE